MIANDKAMKRGLDNASITLNAFSHAFIACVRHFYMENSNSIDVNRQISQICSHYQSERVSGQWYIEQTGLNKVAKILGGEYKDLTKKQRTELRSDCLNCALDYIDVRSWWYYLNCA